MSKAIDTDTRTFIRFWMIPVVIYAIYLLLGMAWEGLVIVGISIFLALALKPLVHKVNDFFNRHFGVEKKHQTASAVLAYFIVVLIIGGIIAVIGPVVINETSKFVQNFPETFENNFGGWDGVNEFGKNFGIQDLHTEISNAVHSLSNNLLGILGNNFVSSVSNVAGIAMKIVLVLVLTLLFLIEGPDMMNIFWKSLSTGEENKKPINEAKRILSRMASVISTFVSRQLLVATIDGCATGLIVFILTLCTGLSPTLAVPMGLITMIFYLIPMFGQFIGAALVTVILFFSSPLAAAIFAVVYLLYSQIENNLISPRIQGNALNLPAIMILIAITIGMYMFGLLGAIIAVPIAGCVRVLIDEYPNIKAARKE